MRFSGKSGPVVLLALCLCAAGPSGRAIDNPDAPDRVAAFASRSAKFEQSIQDAPSGSLARAYREYEDFLARELAAAYATLSQQVGAKRRADLAKAQQQWQRYRDAEFRFIDENWTPEDFGTSYVISRGDYRTTVLKERIVQLLHYLKNYPE